MAKGSYSPDIDQFDPKVHRETLGSFGTTTAPGENQLKALQAKIRQGVKHVELHLNSTGKGEFGRQDTPDKYGFEQRRTIMQLAKLNQQTLSVHSALDNVSFSGFGREGFNDSERARAIKEMDETISFAAETTKGGAVVFHLQGEGLSSSKTDLNLSEKYIEWLKNNPDKKYRDEYDRIKKEYLSANPYDRRFNDNPLQKEEMIREFNELKKSNSALAKKYEEDAKLHKREAWEQYVVSKNVDKLKLQPSMNPLIVVGDTIDKVDRSQEFLDVGVLRSKKFDKKEAEVLGKLGVNLGEDFSISDFQKLSGIFTAKSIPQNYRKVFSELGFSQEDFLKLKKRLVVDYSNLIEEKNFLQPQADKTFFEKFNETQIELVNLQKRDLETRHNIFHDELKRIKVLEDENERASRRLQNLDSKDEVDKAAADAIKMEIAKRSQEIMILQQNSVGLSEYQQLSRYDEVMAQLNQKLIEFEKRKDNVNALTDVVFDKNTASLGHFGIQALRNQLELKQKSKSAKEVVEKKTAEVLELEKKYQQEGSSDKRDEINSKIIKLKAELRNWVGLQDYNDIDLVNKPLYVAPENMLPGMGSLTPLEEYKAMMRMGWEKFAEKILSAENKKLREEYEKEIGQKIKTREDAIKVAKRHIAGTFDNAHLGAWLKHFRRIEGESEEQRIAEFNKWINSQAEEMAKEGLIKHIHFNDSKGKDDDHNLLGQGILDIHDLRERLRKAGINEPFIVEAGGRGANEVMHITNAFDVFNPVLFADKQGSGAKTADFTSGVSDWVKVERDYLRRNNYSTYGMSYNTFRAAPPQDSNRRGEWSGLGFF